MRERGRDEARHPDPGSVDRLRDPVLDVPKRHDLPLETLEPRVRLAFAHGTPAQFVASHLRREPYIE